MRRRRFMALVGSVVAWPLHGRAQTALPVVGVLGSTATDPNAALIGALRDGLAEAGYIDGRNVAFTFRWADGDYDRLPHLAAELLRDRPAVIVASGGNVSAQAARAATATVPVVFTAVSYPVESGLVVSLNRPSGNVTGVGVLTGELDAKRLELMHELVPTAGSFAVLVNPDNPQTRLATMAAMQSAAHALGRELVVVEARAERDFEPAFATLAERRVRALVVAADPAFTSARQSLVALAAQQRLLAAYQWREFVTAGGLLSYGASIADAYRLAGGYVGRILKGARAADLPVLQPTQFELILNLRTARALGLTIPPSLLVRADEVID